MAARGYTTYETMGTNLGRQPYLHYQPAHFQFCHLSLSKWACYELHKVQLHLQDPMSYGGDHDNGPDVLSEILCVVVHSSTSGLSNWSLQCLRPFGVEAK